MSNADGAKALTSAEFRTLFDDFAELPALILAVSGGPDSTALLVLAAKWRKISKRSIKTLAALCANSAFALGPIISICQL